jgi:hypothetical protein
LVAVVATGVYLAFDGGPDASGPDDPGIGPYDEIVLRGARAVGDRAGAGRVIALRSSAGSWRDAESSSSESDQAAIGRGDLRVSAGDGEVVIRFSSDEVAGHTSVPDLGPFAVVVVGTHELRGDEDTLAVRVSRISPWQLTDKAGAGFQGTMKDAIIFVPTGQAAATQPRRSAAISEPRRSPPESPKGVTPDGVGAPGVAAPEEVEAPAAAADDPAPSVWVDRVKAAPTIYISRPDRKR